MKKLKPRILNTALLLFNEKGLAQVSMRTIAEALNKSVGNLTYHYKTRGVIVEALYQQLVERMNVAMEGLVGEELTVGLLVRLSRTTLEQFYAYRFFMLDFVQIMRNYPSIRQHYQQLSAMRQAQFRVLFGQMTQHGILRPPIFEKEYDYFYQRMQVFGDFWLSAAAIQHDQIRPELIEEHLQITLASFYPYLTDKGRAQYQALQQA